MVYVFTLKYQIDGDARDDADLVERLGAGGCDDALIGTGQAGRVALEFSREGVSAASALRSALSDVRRVVPNARLIEVSPDLVGLSDVAQRVGVSRQNLRQLMLAHTTTFPAPVHEGTTSIWHLADVLSWLRDQCGYEVDEESIVLADAARQANVAKESQRLSRRPPKALEALVG
jgi:hypothetical protein